MPIIRHKVGDWARKYKRHPRIIAAEGIPGRVIMDKEKAIEHLKHQKDALEKLRHSHVGDETFKKWYRDTRVMIENIFGSDAKHVKEFENISFHPKVLTTDKEQRQMWKRKGFEEDFISARALLSSLLDEIERFGVAGEGSDSISNPSQNILLIFDKFKSIARQLQSRHDNRPTITMKDEYDVQDLLHTLLRLFFDDIRPEEWTPSYAGGASRMDFLLKNEKIVIEVKKTRSGLKEEEIGEQLIIDIAKYKSHPDCQKLICFIYDPEGRIGNPASLENDLSGTKDGLEVSVYVRPKS